MQRVHVVLDYQDGDDTLSVSRVFATEDLAYEYNRLNKDCTFSDPTTWDEDDAEVVLTALPPYLRRLRLHVLAFIESDIDTAPLRPSRQWCTVWLDRTPDDGAVRVEFANYSPGYPWGIRLTVSGADEKAARRAFDGALPELRQRVRKVQAKRLKRTEAA